MFFKVIDKKYYTIKKGFLNGSLAFMQYFKFVNWWFRFLMSQTGYMRLHEAARSLKSTFTSAVLQLLENRQVSKNRKIALKMFFCMF